MREGVKEEEGGEKRERSAEKGGRELVGGWGVVGEGEGEGERGEGEGEGEGEEAMEGAKEEE